MSYTFGDNEEASRRLRRLADLYEPETRALLELAFDGCEACTPRLAVDLGCGPGWSTQLLAAVLKPQRTVGLDSSEHTLPRRAQIIPGWNFCAMTSCNRPSRLTRLTCSFAAFC